MTKEEAIELIDDVIGFVEDNQGRDYDTAFRMAIEALSTDAEDTQTEERARFVAKETELAHIEAKLENAEKRLQGACVANFVAEQLERLKDMTDEERLKLLQTMFPSIEAKSTVIKSKTLLPTKDFKEWAKRIREVNPNAVVIPCDAEVTSSEYEETDGVITIEKQSAKDVGEIKHIVVRSPNHTRYFHNESMPISADVVSREEYEEVKAYMDTLVDAFIEDGEELAESVKVVRCKDCKHYIVEGITTQYGWCHEYKHSVDEDDYCSYGERKK